MKKSRDYWLILAPVLILVAVGWIVAWSNHFQSGFHFDDIPTIVANEPMHHLSSIPRFFVNPRISSAEKDSATYQPLLSSWFAFDYWLSGPNPFTFQLENWLWLAAVLLMLFLLFRAIPGIDSLAAAFAALLFGLHPVVADTVNYILQRGVIMGTFGVTAGLLIFIYWPWRLPQTMPLKLKRVPEHGLDEYLRKNYDRLEQTYLKIIHAPIGLYLWPVVPALLAWPGAAVFAPILLAYILLFETRRTARHAIPAAVVCIGYWIFQFLFTWNLGQFRRSPAANYWFTEPWVAMRYLGRFFVPIHLSVDTGLGAFAHFWDPLAIAGYAGLAALVALALWTARVGKWRAVSFGLWWFLAALLPDAVAPHRVVEANWRMFLPMAGLALSLAGGISMALRSLPRPNPEEPRSFLPFSIAGTLAIALLAVLGWATWERSAVWQSELTLWRDATVNSPGNGRAWMRYGLARQSSEPAAAFADIRRAAVVTPNDPLIEVTLANAFERRSEVSQAENQFRRALADGQSWSPAYSAYGQWLLRQTRNQEARQMSLKAVALDPYDMVARRALMDIMAQEHQWDKLKQFADNTVGILPDDPDAQRSLEVAQTGLDHIEKVELRAQDDPTINNYLALSVEYFNTQRYQDCVTAAQEALKVQPNQAEAYANMATCYHALGKLDDTIAALREEVRLNPALPGAKHNLDVELAEKAKQQAR